MPYDADIIDPQLAAFGENVATGLSRRPKKLSPRWLYDDRGCDLFEQITRLPEYYPTRTETGILSDNAQEIADFCGTDAVMLEYGAGAGIKTEIILDALDKPCRYVPIDIAANFLRQTAARFERLYPGLATTPVVGDFTAEIQLPASLPAANRFGFFSGSTIGNLDVEEAIAFLLQLRRHVGPSGKCLIGVDLKKDVPTLIDAYDDGQGVTAEFNLNLLRRINRELDGSFALDQFHHRAVWNAAESAIEMHLVSKTRQTVRAAGQLFEFAEGETIHTESSRKYDYRSFAALAANADWRLDRVWTDEEEKFAIFGLTPN